MGVGGGTMHLLLEKSEEKKNMFLAKKKGEPQGVKKRISKKGYPKKVQGKKNGWISIIYTCKQRDLPFC